MDLNWKLNKTEHIVQDEWIDFRKESFIGNPQLDRVD